MVAVAPHDAAIPPVAPPGRSLAHVLGRLAALEAAVQAAVEARRAADPGIDDPFRGLYLGEDDVDRVLAATPRAAPGPAARARRAQVEEAADADEGAGADLRLRRLARDAGLDATDIDLLVVALAPDLDHRFERLYGYLHDDVTRRRASVGLALELAGLHPADVAARDRLGPRGPLAEGGIVAVDDADRPFLTRSLRVPDRVAAHLLGGDRPDPAVADLLVEPVPMEVPDDGGLGRLVTDGDDGAPLLAYVVEEPGASGRSFAAAALGAAGRLTLVADLERLEREPPVAGFAVTARALTREARLAGAVLVAGPVDHLAERGPELVRLLAEAGVHIVLTGRRHWEPGWSRQVPVLVTAPAPAASERARVWRTHLDGQVAPGLDPADATAQFRLTPEQVAEAATAAANQARLTGEPVDAGGLRRGARSRNGAGLERKARRIEPAVGWDDLVLPPASLEGLTDLALRVRHRDQVLSEWAMRPGGGRGLGVTALFAGDSGTGKTMSAEVIAGHLGLDLYVIDLATVVDKYVGETEKNLERVFGEADGVNGVLLFDEADAIFGKRSEVRDAHDRYANIEVAYLLQRMETFDGLAILTTNLRANLDDAFTRRLDAIVDFPLPDEEHRRVLWERCLGPSLPRSGDVDLDFCARQFELAGGHIRSIALTAAYLAAGRGTAVCMADLMAATRREYRKLGRLVVRAEFDTWLDLDDPR
ncbi:MAG TPA: ATP-binding protein [Acidimicrobiales bacterium]|nr:ATP-binding protein [Acidimicrobiales bacterium]